MRRLITYPVATERRIVESPFSRSTKILDPVFTGEKLILDVVPLREVIRGVNPAYEPDDSFTSHTWKVGLGLVDSPPIAGSWKATYNTSTSTEISYNESSESLQTILNAMTDVTTAGGVDVTGDYETGYRIEWRTSGAVLDFGTDEVNLLPESTVSFNQERAGDTNITEVIQVRLMQQQAGLTTSPSTIAAGSMTSTQKVAGARGTRETVDITCIPDTTAVAQVDKLTVVAAGGVYAINTVTTVADVASSLNGLYFTTYDDEGSHGWWIDVGDTGTTIPAACAALDRATEITTITAGDSDGVIADLIATAINADSKYTATHDGNVITITNSTVGDHGATEANTSTFSVAQPTTGAATAAYSTDYFDLYALASDGTETRVGFFFTETGADAAPAAGALALNVQLYEIFYDPDSSADEMAGRIATAVTAISGITATQSGTDVRVIQDNAGAVTNGDATASSLTLTNITAGSDSSLDGDHFIMYESDGAGGENSHAYWYNVSGNAEPSGTAITADLATEITTVAPGALAIDVAAATAAILTATGGMTATVHGTKIEVVHDVVYNFTTATAETSGFTIAVSTEGGTGTDASAIYELSFSDVAMGGVYSIGIDTGNGVVQSAGIPVTADDIEIKETLEDMSNVAVNDILVEGGSGGDLRMSFQNNLESTVVTVTVDDSGVQWVEGFRFTLNLNTTTAQALMYGLDSLECILEVEAKDGSNSTTKLVHSDVTLKNGLIDDSALAPTPLASYYTSDQVDNLIIHHLKTITSLTGGTSSDLDSIVTTTITPERAIFMWDADNSQYSLYVLQSGTTAESAPDTIRPDDYAASTNEKIWTKWTPGITDHGAMGGLLDDDHTQYLLVDGTRAGTGIQEFLGINFTDFTIKTISIGAITVTQALTTVAAETGTADDLATITAAKGHGDIVFLKADTGDTITVKDGTGNISLRGGDLTITGDQCVQLLYDGSSWCEVGNAEDDTAGGGRSYNSDATLTSLIGGTAADLDSVVTTTLTIGDLMTVVVPSGSGNELELTYRLDSDTATEDAPWTVRPDDYAAITNERVWTLIAPWQWWSFEVFGAAEEHATGDHYFAYTPAYWKISEVQCDMAALPSGTGSGVLEWNVIINSADLFSANVTQSARVWRAIDDESSTFAAGIDTTSPKHELEMTIDDIGGLTPGTGVVLHFRVLHSPINT